MRLNCTPPKLGGAAIALSANRSKAGRGAADIAADTFGVRHVIRMTPVTRRGRGLRYEGFGAW